MDHTDIEQLIRKVALENAIRYGGTARVKSVIGKVLAARPELRERIGELLHVFETILNDVNGLSRSEQKDILCNMPEMYPVKSIDRTKPGEKKLPPLPNVEKYPLVRVRFCPNPDGALHLGGARAAILCDEYARMYNGRFILRFDDSDPRTKSPIPEAYDWIINDLDWLGVRWHSKVYQSDRLEVYYGYTRKLIEIGVAYICTCRPRVFRQLISTRRACPCRTLPPNEHLTRWRMMLGGSLGVGEAVVRIKTDLDHPNPAVRDWPALRIIDPDKFPHPRTGDRYRVWPLFAFCCGIDDHELGISHIIRGKEHLTNTVRQLFLFDYLGWDYPEAIHYGRLKITGSELSKSKIRIGIAKGIYTGWDDPRLGTLTALRKRGFLPDTVRRLILEIGPKPVDATISWDNIQASNRKLLDPLTDRYFFVAHPIKLTIRGVDRPFVSELPLHPGDPTRGNRTVELKPKARSITLAISKRDLGLFEPGKIVRLMGLFNVMIKRVIGQVQADYHSAGYMEAKQIAAPLIHWIPYNTGVETSVVMPDASVLCGHAEDSCRQLEPNAIVQFERFGFVRVENITAEALFVYYTHR